MGKWCSRGRPRRHGATACPRLPTARPLWKRCLRSPSLAMARTRLIPVTLSLITDEDLEAIRSGAPAALPRQVPRSPRLRQRRGRCREDAARGRASPGACWLRLGPHRQPLSGHVRRLRPLGRVPPECSAPPPGVLGSGGGQSGGREREALRPCVLLPRGPPRAALAGKERETGLPGEFLGRLDALAIGGPSGHRHQGHELEAATFGGQRSVGLVRATALTAQRDSVLHGTGQLAHGS